MRRFLNSRDHLNLPEVWALQRLTFVATQNRLSSHPRRRVEMMSHIRRVGPTSLTEAGPGEAHASPETSRKKMVD